MTTTNSAKLDPAVVCYRREKARHAKRHAKQHAAAMTQAEALFRRVQAALAPKAGRPKTATPKAAA